jgi:GTP-binding protein
MDNSDPAENYRKIRAELEAFSPELAQKREVIAANKMDLVPPGDDNAALDKLMEALPEREIFAISGATRQGVDPLLEELWRMLHHPEEDATGAA